MLVDTLRISSHALRRFEERIVGKGHPRLRDMFRLALRESVALKRLTHHGETVFHNSDVSCGFVIRWDPGNEDWFVVTVLEERMLVRSGLLGDDNV